MDRLAEGVNVAAMLTQMTQPQHSLEYYLIARCRLRSGVARHSGDADRIAAFIARRSRLMAAALDSLEQIRATVIDLTIKFGPKVLAALLILSLGFLVGRWTSRWLQRALLHLEMEPPVRALIARAVRVAITVLFVIMALQNLGVELLPLIAGLGVAGAGVALAMQGVLSNLFAGLTIILTKPFRIGQYIAIVGEEGEVQSITLFQTILSHPDRSQVVIPNRKIAGEILHNYGKIRLLNVLVGVAYDSDLNRVLGLIQQVMQESSAVMRDVEPVVRVNTLADSWIEIAVRPWVAVSDHGAATGDVYKRIVEVFREHNVVMPFPQRQVRLLEGAA
jgi:small conductance mechanosensitive channel